MTASTAGWTSKYDGMPVEQVRLHRINGQYSGRATQSAWVIEIGHAFYPGTANTVNFLAGHHWSTCDENGVPVISGPIIDVARTYDTKQPYGSNIRWRLTVNDMSFILKSKILPPITIDNPTKITRDENEFARARAIWLIENHFPAGLISNDYSQIADAGTMLAKSESFTFQGQSGTSINFRMEFAGLSLWQALDSIFTFGGFLWYCEPDPNNYRLSRIVAYDPTTRFSSIGLTDFPGWYAHPDWPTTTWVSFAEGEVHTDLSKHVNALRILYVGFSINSKGEYIRDSKPSQRIIENESSIEHLANPDYGDDGRRWDTLDLGVDCPTGDYAESLGRIYMRWKQLANIRGTIRVLYDRVGMTIKPGMTVPIAQVNHSFVAGANVNSISIDFADTPDNLPTWITYNFSQDPYTWPTGIGAWVNDPIRLAGFTSSDGTTSNKKVDNNDTGGSLDTGTGATYILATVDGNAVGDAKPWWLPGSLILVGD